MGDPEALSIQSAFPQFFEMERKHGGLIKAARASKAHAAKVPQVGGPQYSMFVAPRRGMSQFVAALADRLEVCRKHFNQRVDLISPAADGGWRVEFTDHLSGIRQSMRCQGVVVALPAYQAGNLLASVNQELSRLLAAIPYAGCIAVNLAFDRQAVPHPLDSFGFVSPHVEKRSVLACTFSSVKYGDRAPEGKALLRAFLGGACYPEVQDWSDDEVLRAVKDELRELLGIRESPLFSRIAQVATHHATVRDGTLAAHRAH